MRALATLAFISLPVAVSMSACGGTEPSEVSTFAGRIVYSSDRTGESKLYVTDASGADFGPVPIVLVGRQWRPDVSPDGIWVAFEYYGEIYVSRADGTGVRNVTNSETDDDRPKWSPDGERILFSSYNGTSRHLYVINADGTGLFQLTEGETEEFSGDWSPDGSRIVFGSAGENGGLEVINADGSGREILLAGEDGGSQPAWSPDGSTIAFVSGDAEIYLVDAEGINRRLLGEPEPNRSNPAWSPDGQSIAYVHFGEIVIVGVDGQNATVLTDSPSDFDGFPAWGPALE